jgi:tripartite-type tricarboxylate transporter receptor subunit TctC
MSSVDIHAGKLRALGVTSPQRSPTLPDVPTIAEAGVRGYEAASWFGVFAPEDTPQPIIDRLNSAIVFAAFVQAEIAKWVVFAT